VESKPASVVLHLANEVFDSVSRSIVQGDDGPGVESSGLLELVVASGDVPGTLVRFDVHLE
jgi:hypothetical protein